jgi:hypothetical protein
MIMTGTSATTQASATNRKVFRNASMLACDNII